MCKCEHYGNCDPETKDQEYCIFHKPNKNKKEAEEFWRKFLEKFKHRKGEQYEIILEDKKGEKVVRRRSLIFESEMDCKGYVFPRYDRELLFGFFHNAVFKRAVDFSKVTFEGDISFIGATFEGYALFEGATFEGDVWFEYAIFKGNVCFSVATFRGKAWFECATFKDEVWFGSVIFKDDAWFTSVTFESTTSFNDTTFENYALFIGATFKDIARFDGVIFENEASFNGATFKDDAWFKGTFKSDTSLERVTFEKYAEFTCKFHGKLSFANAKIRAIDILKSAFKLPEAEAEACRVQRMHYEKEGKKGDADKVFVRERRALRRARIRETKLSKSEKSTWKSKLEYLWTPLLAYASSLIEFLLADLTCVYGTNWKRPIILWIFIVLLVFPLLYFITKTVPNAYDFLSCMYFSIVTATTLGYGDLHPVGIGRILASIEAIFGTYMWAVFLVVFARKYMR